MCQGQRVEIPLSTGAGEEGTSTRGNAPEQRSKAGQESGTGGTHVPRANGERTHWSHQVPLKCSALARDDRELLTMGWQVSSMLLCAGSGPHLAAAALPSQLSHSKREHLLCPSTEVRGSSLVSPPQSSTLLSEMRPFIEPGAH